MEIVGYDMNKRISETINTFFSKNKKTVAGLIRDMKLDKADFTSLVKKINTSSSFAEFAPAQVYSMAELKKEPLIDLFRDSSLRINRLFNAANAGGLVLDSMVGIISSDIEKIEEDIKNLEIFINNYEFLSGKDDLYTGNYIEKFDNFLNDYTADGYNFAIPDRDNSSFPMGGNAYIDSSSGLMKIGVGQTANNIINNIKSVKIVNNYANYISSDSKFENVFTDSLADSWSVTIKSPAVLTSELSDYAQYLTYDSVIDNGAKIAIEIDLHSTIEVDTIKLSPNFGNGLQILQIVLLDKIDTDGLSTSSVNTTSLSSKLLLNSPKIINDKTEILFEKFRTNKIIMIFNQASYTRSKQIPITSELNSKAMDTFVKTKLEENRSKFSKYQDIAYWFFNRRYTVRGLKKNKNSDIEYYSYRFPESLHSYAKYVERELVKASNYSIADNPVFVNSPIFIDLVNSMLNTIVGDKKYLNIGPFIDSRYGLTSSSLSNPGFIPTRNTDNINNQKYQFYNDGYSPTMSYDLIKSLFVEESSDVYEYNFSLKAIDFIYTTSGQSDKACFVSKKIPVNGQVLGVKSKVQIIENSITSTENQYDIRDYSSYELSISNVDYPISENDWIPIAFNEESSINSEIVFFDITNFSAKLRFKPKYDSIVLYKDGMIVASNAYEYRIESDRLILKDSTKYSPTSIFCVSYTINDSIYDPYQIDLLKSNSYKESIKQYKNSSGLGQVFPMTSVSNTIELEYVPYVNTNALNTAKYDQFFGTIFTNSFNGYSPVRVLLSDGTYATNITNYTRSTRQVEFFGTDSVQFIQTGKSILFNQPITSAFTVLYEYVPYGLRFRLVIRKNIPAVEIPARADSVLLKLKTSHFDPYYDKLVYTSKV